MKRIVIFVGLLSLILWASCSDDKTVNEPAVIQPDNDAGFALQDNVRPDVVPPATVPLLPAPSPKTAVEPPAPFELLPAELNITLRQGESYTEDKELVLGDVIPKGDILFAIDLTGSMWEELDNVKANSINIMTEINTRIPDTQFGLVSHMDYNGTYEGCDYGPASYGSGPDYPYSLDQALTATTGNVATAISGLSEGYGDDGPEDYSRIFYESYSDAGIGWRPDVKKVMIQWGDAVPHACDIGLDCGIFSGVSYGPDPGPDAIAGNADDLDLAAVLQGMADSGISLIALHSGGFVDLWDCYAAKTGGDAVQINPDGTIPGGEDIADFVADLIEAEFSMIDEVKLEVCDPEYAGWVSISPASYEDVTLPGDPLPFVVTITVPVDAEIKEHCFEICAIADGVVVARQSVCVDVVRTPVYLDIKPGSCPNPFNPKANGVVPVGIAGSDDLDVSEVDPGSITLEGRAPVNYEYLDTTQPHGDEPGSPEDCDDCFDEDMYSNCDLDGDGVDESYCGDGKMDLILYFDNRDLADALGDWEEQCRELELLGELWSGKDIIGNDKMTLRKKL